MVHHFTEIIENKQLYFYEIYLADNTPTMGGRGRGWGRQADRQGLRGCCDIAVSKPHLVAGLIALDQ